MKRKYELYLDDILEAIERIKEYTADMAFEDFKNNKITIDATLRNLEIIGEAATQVPKEVQEENKEIPWRDIKDFRIVVAHKYWKINLERIWDILENKLDELHEQISKIK